MTLTRFEFTSRVRPLLQVGLGSTVFGEGAALWDVSLWDAPSSLWNGDEPLWRDVSCDAITAHIEAGRGRVMDSFPVGTADVTVSNQSGWADPSLDFEVDAQPGYIVFDGNGGHLSTPDVSGLSFAGDFEIIFRLYVTAAPSTGSVQIMSKGDDPDLAYRVTYFDNTDINVEVSDDGTVAGSSFFLTAGQPRSVGQWRWFGFAFDADNAGDHHGTWWYGGAGDNVGAWQLIETGIWPGAMTIHDSAAALLIGQQMNGRLSHFELRQGHGGMSGDDVTIGSTNVRFKIDGWMLSDFDVGAATLTDATGKVVTVVTDGASTPTIVPAVNPAGSPRLEMRPGRPVRIGVQHATFGTRWRFNGFIDEILPVDDPADWSTVQLRCIDALGEAGRAKLRTEVESGAGETARARFIRLLDSIMWPATKRAISTSAIRTLYAAELDGQMVDLLRQTADSEGGWAFGDDQGRVVLQHRDWLFHVPGDEVDGIIGNFGDVSTELWLENGEPLLLENGEPLLLETPGDEVCPGRWERSFARADITTRVILDRDLPSTVESEDEPPPLIRNDVAAQVLYGIEPYERRDLWTLSDSDLQIIAGRIIGTRAAALSMPRIRSVEIDAATSDAAVDLLSTLSIFRPSRYLCRLRTDRGDVFEANFFACGVTEDIAADSWTASISLDRTRPFAVLDSVDYVWDTARWDRSLWN